MEDQNTILEEKVIAEMSEGIKLEERNLPKHNVYKQHTMAFYNVKITKFQCVQTVILGFSMYRN